MCACVCVSGHVAEVWGPSGATSLSGHMSHVPLSSVRMFDVCLHPPVSSSTGTRRVAGWFTI